MTNLLSIIRDCFTYTTGIYNTSYYNLRYLDNIYQMNIPIYNNVIDVPVFATGAFIEALKQRENNKIDSIIVTLDTYTTTSAYKSLDAIIKGVFSMHYNNYKLIKFFTPGNPERTYYGIRGAIFDSNLKPVIIFSWRLTAITDNLSKYKCLKPILWVSPTIFTQKDDSLMRYIINKIIPTTLNLRNLYGLSTHTALYSFESSGSACTPDIEIGNFPFVLEKPDVPSVSTTNEKLLKVALDNIDEVVLCP